MIEVLIEADAWRAAEPAAARLARRTAAAVLAHEGRRASMAILLADDDRLACLNRAFRGRIGPTNVLAFPAVDPVRDGLGDIALAFGVCVREAVDQNKPLADHLRHLTAHGVLHLLGYDHHSEAEAATMEAKERAILAGLGTPDPYRREARQGTRRGLESKV